ncbi:VHL beta domain-containing protein [Ditylenchus destructor]|nr:VHL beta domain-containing protein [Ditylenchus destructor]
MDNHNAEIPLSLWPENRLAVVPVETGLVPVGNVRQNPQLKYVFCNMTDRDVDVIWIDLRNNATCRYAQLTRKNRRVDIGTYENHRWIFRDSYDGENLSFIVKSRRNGTWTETIDNTKVLIGRTPANGSSVQIVCIQTERKVLSFRHICVRKICAKIKARSICDLGLPRFLEVEVAEYMLKCINYRAKYDEHLYKLKDEYVECLERVMKGNKLVEEIAEKVEGTSANVLGIDEV